MGLENKQGGASPPCRTVAERFDYNCHCEERCIWQRDVAIRLSK